MAPTVHVCLWLAICAAISGCRTAPNGELPDPVGHVIDVHARPWSSDLAPDARVVEAAPPTDGQRSQVVTRGGRQAFVATVANEGGRDGESQIEFVYFITDGRCFRIEGLPLPWRPYSDLAWASDRYLIFDRWSQPHYGVHYVVDTVERRVVHVAPFPDRFFLDH